MNAASTVASVKTPPTRAAEPVGGITLRDLLFPSDLTAASDRAYDHARLLAETFGAHLVLYHAVEVDRPEDLGDPPEPAREHWRRVEIEAREHLSRRSTGVAVPSEILLERTTSAPRALVAFVRAHRPDLTVMATHGRKGMAHLVLGSVAETVLQHARSPVLCVREPDHGVALPYRRVLVPTDLSEASRRAFPLAAALACTFGAEVLALHVAPLQAESTFGMSYEVERLLPSDEDLVAFLGAGFAGVRVSPRVLLGSAWDRITETAREERADVVVMSTHGRDSLADRVLGSHAERVVRAAPCPVLVV